MNVRDDVGSKGRHFSFKMDEKVHVNVTKCLYFLRFENYTAFNKVSPSPECKSAQKQSVASIAMDFVF